MRRILRTIARTGQDHEVWPVVLFLVAVLAPAACLLWFMNAAMSNERLAARQRLAEAYQGQLAAAQTRLDEHWQAVGLNLQTLARAASAPAAFARAVQSGTVDSLVVFDEQGRVLYPNTPATPADDFDSSSVPWAEASRLEYQRRDFAAAAGRYHALAESTTNVHLAARALQAEIRCLAQAGHREAAARLVTATLGSRRYDRAVDPQGRLIVANAELMVLEWEGDHTRPAFQSTAQRLQQRLTDYGNPALAASQRRFLMKELRQLSRGEIDFPTLAAEELAAAVAEHRATPEGTASLQPALVAGTWQFASPDRRVLALFRLDGLLTNLHANLLGDFSSAGAAVSLVAPNTENPAAFASLPAGRHLPGWRLAVTPKHPDLLDHAAQHQAALYLWTGLLVLAGIGILGLLAFRLVRRQMNLARLRNDLAATVSHELKTPLASMRVFVDTLLSAERLDEPKVREYLRLIAGENERLSRLIHNFLTFSRLERRHHSFELVRVPARSIVEAAVNAVRDRFTQPDCRFELRVADDLPDTLADVDASAIALINLLDNAYKFSAGTKHIELRAHAENGHVIFAVRDHGIGMARRERHRVFDPFYQADRRLSRPHGGCGLGLSIVRSIVTAHRGTVSVESQPGAGSTFTISLPAARPEPHRETEDAG